MTLQFQPRISAINGFDYPKLIRHAHFAWVQDQTIRVVTKISSPVGSAHLEGSVIRKNQDGLSIDTTFKLGKPKNMTKPTTAKVDELICTWLLSTALDLVKLDLSGLNNLGVEECW